MHLIKDYHDKYKISDNFSNYFYGITISLSDAVELISNILQNYSEKNTDLIKLLYPDYANSLHVAKIKSEIEAAIAQSYPDKAKARHELAEEIGQSWKKSWQYLGEKESYE